MTKDEQQSLEHLLQQLIDKAVELNVPLTGSVSLPNQTMHFDNQVKSKQALFQNIRDLIGCCGELMPFFMKMTQMQQLALVDEDGRELFSDESELLDPLVLLNPQTISTLH